MALTFPLSGFPDIIRANASGSTNTEQITIKTGAKKASLNFIDSNGYLALSGTDAASIYAHYVTIPAGEIVEFNVIGVDSIFVAAAVSGSAYEVVLER